MLSALTFELYRFRFQFHSAGSLYFPPYKSGNIVRGAFGNLFRRLVCLPGCRDARACEARASCPYARVFEPQAARGAGPSGLADWPRPFVFRAAHLDGRTITPAEEFHFDVHIFDVRDPALAYFVQAFSQLARDGLGPTRGRAELTAVEQLDLSGATVARVFDGERFQMGGLAAPSAVNLDGQPGSAGRLRMRFVTPTELKSGHQLAEHPEFGILFGRLRDRISTLRALYGAGPLEIDFRALGERAAAVRMTRCELQQHEFDRLSSRTGQRHPLGGFVGVAQYEGELTEFFPYLRLGRWVGVGKKTVWGNGEIEVL
jgi:CRISPR-associated endoribonuclease Cas6